MKSNQITIFFFRWFDKSFQLVITRNGKVGKILEHSWGDGMTGIYYGVEMHKDIASQPAVGPDIVVDPKIGDIQRIGELPCCYYCIMGGWEYANFPAS